MTGLIKQLMEDQHKVNICLEETLQKRLMQINEHYAEDVFDPIKDILQGDALPNKKVQDIVKRFGSVENAAAWICGIASVVFPHEDTPLSDKELISIFFAVGSTNMSNIRKFFMTTQLKGKFDEDDFELIGRSLKELNHAIIERGKKVKSIPSFNINGKPVGYEMMVYVLKNYADSKFTSQNRVQFSGMVLKLKQMLDKIIQQRVASLVKDKDTPISHLEQIIGAL